MYFVEKHYLTVHGGSFAETFYGLKRRKTDVGAGPVGGENVRKAAELTGKTDRMGKREIRGSLVFLVRNLCSSATSSTLRTSLMKSHPLVTRRSSSPTSGPNSPTFTSDSAAESTSPCSRHPQQRIPRPRRSPSFETPPLHFPRVFDQPRKPPSSSLTRTRTSVTKVTSCSTTCGTSSAKARTGGRGSVSSASRCGGWVKKTMFVPAFLFSVLSLTSSPEQQRLADLPSTLQQLLAPPPSSPPTTRPGLRLVLSRLLRLTPHLALDSLRVLLPLTIFSFRLLEWWYSPAGGSSRLRGGGGGKASQPALRAPPPSRPAAGEGEPKRGGCVVHSEDEPERAVENPTALPSGWVGCYKCLRGLEEEMVVLPSDQEVERGEFEAREEQEKEGERVYERRKTGRLRDPKSGEWVEVAKLRRIMG